MNPAEIINMASSLASIILAIVSLFLSLWFFTKSKETEQLVTNALAEIKSQTNTLQNLSGKYLDRLTRYVTQPKITDSSLSPENALALAQLPNTIQNVLGQINSVSDSGDEQEDDTLDLIIMLYLNVAQTNFYVQGYLPSAIDFDETNSAHIQIKNILDTTYQNFHYIETRLRSYSTKDIEENYWYPSYSEVQARLKHLVKDANQTMVSKMKSTN